MGVKDEAPVKPKRAGGGVSAVDEVPRGCSSTSTPSTRTSSARADIADENHANIQGDFEKLVPKLLQMKRKEKEIEHALEMLVRAYDPCISCSNALPDRCVREVRCATSSASATTRWG